MQKYHKSFSTLTTPQSEPIPGSNQVANSAGGYAWAVDCWKRLERFLILGADSGTYYIGKTKLIKENAASVLECLKQDGARTVKTIAEISDAGRAPNNDPALFALAMACADSKEDTRKMAFEALPRVARIGTHLFHFAEYLQAFRGWGKLARRHIGQWYTEKEADSLAYQAIKYRQRDGWTHRDLLRLAHPKTSDPARKVLFEWICRGTAAETLPKSVQGFEAIKNAQNGQEAERLISEHRLPWEAVPDQFRDDANVWSALLENMPLAAMVRNLGKMSAIGLLKPLSADSKRVTDVLKDAHAIKKSRIHPIQILLALRTYRSGRGLRGSLSWTVVPSIVEALDAAYYLAFSNVEPTGKRFLLGVDVSGSMGYMITNSGLTCCEAAAAMAMVAVRSEAQVYAMAFGHDFRPLPLNKTTSLNEAVRMAQDANFGGTDCTLPMLHAAERGLEVDAFVVYTDSETWSGGIHPAQALLQYRKQSGIPAKLCVMAFAANEFSIADPDDVGMLDVVGFDASVPQVLAEFVKS